MISNQRPLLIQTQQEMFENPNCQPDKKGFLWGYIWSNVCSCCSRGVIVSWRGVKPKKGLPSTPRPWKPMLGGTESHSFRWTARRVIVFEILFLFIVRIIDKSNQRLWGWKKKKKKMKILSRRNTISLDPASNSCLPCEYFQVSAGDKLLGKIHAFPQKFTVSWSVQGQQNMK